MRRAICASVLSAVLAPAGVAHADASVSVTLNAQGQQLASDLGITVADLMADAEARIDDLYQLSNLEGLLRSFADTGGFAARGLGVDYDPDPGDAMVGIAAGGVHGDVAIGTTSSLLGGSIVNLNAMAGVNLGRWGQPRWTVFGNGFYETTTINGIDGHLLTLGAHVQYRVLPASAPARVRWTGLAATTGVEYAKWTLESSRSIESHFTAHGTSTDKTIHMSSTGPLSVLASTLTVPIEVTTGVRFFDTLGLYAGAGLDLTTGDSTISAQLDSVLSINADHLPVGTAVITGSASNTPTSTAVHALAGFEIHTRHVRVFLQGGLSSGEEAVSLGVRVVF